MKIVVYDNDTAGVNALEKMLKNILGERAEIVRNPPPTRVLSDKGGYDRALFLIDTRYTVTGGNFLTLARHIRECSETCHIAFTSMFTTDMAFCYKKLVRPSAFFLKPVDESELREFVTDIENFEKARRSQLTEPQIVLESHGTKTVVRISDILYFTAQAKKLLCYTESNGEVPYTFYGTLSALEKTYREYFIRCHSGFLVNCQRIEQFNKTAMTLHVRGTNEKISVSKSRLREVESFVNGTGLPNAWKE